MCINDPNWTIFTNFHIKTKILTIFKQKLENFDKKLP